jgi:hypothetical protein
VPGKSETPVFDYSHQHHVDCVTQFLLDYLCDDKLTVKIFGKQDLKKGKKDAAGKAAAK